MKHRKQNSIISKDSESYLDRIEEFHNGNDPSKKLNAHHSAHQQQQQVSFSRLDNRSNTNPCDETIGCQSIVDEYEYIDSRKHLPRESCTICKLLFLSLKHSLTILLPFRQIPKEKRPGRVLVPCFQIEESPFAKSARLLGERIGQQSNQTPPVRRASLKKQSVHYVEISESNGRISHSKQKSVTDDEQVMPSYSNKIANSNSVHPTTSSPIEEGAAKSTNSSEQQSHPLHNSKPETMKQHSEQQNLSINTEAIAQHPTISLPIAPTTPAIPQAIHFGNHMSNPQQQQLWLQKKEPEHIHKSMTEEELFEIEVLKSKSIGEPVTLAEDEQVIYTLVKREFSFQDKHISNVEMGNIVREFSKLTMKDESRADSSHKEGGKECKDKKIRECLRGIGKEIIRQVGSKILSGSFNLTQISFPIRAMIPKTALEKSLYSTILFPLYINMAAKTNNLVERFKLLICATLGNFYINLGFLKPLNPILGETCSGFYSDGTRLYAEQISHHPPISYFSVYGPNKSYLMYGNYNFESNAGLNSLKLKNKGSRHIKFHDGQHIQYNFAKEEYSGSFWGAMKVESKGTIKFIDAGNGITAEISMGSVKKKPSDYLSGVIKVKDQVVSKCHGSYMGFIEFDGSRYWDYKHIIPYEPVIINSDIGSDQSKRQDKQELLKGDIENAQKHKEELERVQRHDAKLRKKGLEARQKENKSKKM